MRADNSHHVIASARRRAEATHRRAAAALRRIDTARTPVSFEAVAREAGVSRSWLYSQPDIRSEIERLRGRQQPNRRQVPDRQRASDASLLNRLQAATERIRHLENDNRRLRLALAEALGEQRAGSSGRLRPVTRSLGN
ncbi:transposase [Actinoplanes sp. ATCC 53533]|uniref:DUF6262 family protein n=1 Tax=Actinoplanes sp. ATCC 53533 TaxID=1288362 RepID=UPI000F79C188|nr:DUF6262 family protein [Actinoplanes sp. ATCC 53533]RSM67930.1 transposase [Actinoplanes sp. ATCC 53533]